MLFDDALKKRIHKIRYDKIISGSVAEWLKAHDSKSCGQQCLGGSNPFASAILELNKAHRWAF